MKKLTLLIADSDENYINSLEEYLRTNYSDKFNLHFFTSLDYLNSYLSKPESKADILLHGFVLSQKKNLLKNVYSCIFLDENRTYREKDNITSVYKFQHVDKIISDILVIYSKNNSNVTISSGQKNTVITSVFSSMGGSGKSSIAGACSMMCAKRGMRVFYLNIERISSTPLFFKANSEESFSKIIYYLKEKSKNINFKIEAAKSVDPDSKVHFFVKPDNILDTRELEAEELEKLLACIRMSSQYDHIFIDMSEGLDLLNLKGLILSDIIINVSLPGKICELKNAELSAAISVIEKKHSTDIFGKTINVINRFVSENNYIQDSQETVYQVAINESRTQRHIYNPKMLIDDIEFSKGINCLIERICKDVR